MQVVPAEVAVLKLEADSLQELAAVEAETDPDLALVAAGTDFEDTVQEHHKKAHLVVGGQSSVGFVAALCLYPRLINVKKYGLLHLDCPMKYLDVVLAAPRYAEPRELPKQQLIHQSH